MDVVFDFGNVLLEWNPSQLVREHFAHGLPNAHTPESFASGLVSDDWVAYDNGDLNLHGLVASLAPKLGCDEATLASFIAHIPRALPPMMDSIAAMESLFDDRDRGAPIRVFYLSNMPREFADLLEQRFSWIARFDGGIFSARARLSKPSAAIYAALESQCALNPDYTLFLDDSAANVEAARQRGWSAVHVRETGDVRRGLQAAGVIRA